MPSVDDGDAGTSVVHAVVAEKVDVVRDDIVDCRREVVPERLDMMSEDPHFVREERTESVKTTAGNLSYLLV